MKGIKMKVEITIEQTPEIVWGYFTEPTHWVQWWGGGLKAAQWQKNGKLEWVLGGSSKIESIIPNKMVKIDGGWMSTTFTFELYDTGKTIVKLQESSPAGGASFSDGGAAHLSQLNTSLIKLKENIERETEPASQKNKTMPELICPYCNSALQGMALITTKVSLETGVVDFKTNCSSCGRVLTLKDFQVPQKKAIKPKAKKWWEFWR
jgi:uncharacterized protein YndB with AHSA1/START domain